MEDITYGFKIGDKAIDYAGRIVTIVKRHKCNRV